MCPPPPTRPPNQLVNLKKAGMANRNIVIKNNTRCFKSAFAVAFGLLVLVLYILADLISSLEIQRLQLAGSSSTVFAVNLILYYCVCPLKYHVIFKFSWDNWRHC